MKKNFQQNLQNNYSTKGEAKKKIIKFYKIPGRTSRRKKIKRNYKKKKKEMILK